MASTATKLSISVPNDLADALKKRVGPRGLSGFVARAIAHELEREQLQGFLDELERDHGPVSKAALSAARKSWPKH